MIDAYRRSADVGSAVEGEAKAFVVFWTASFQHDGQHGESTSVEVLVHHMHFHGEPTSIKCMLRRRVEVEL